MIHLQSLRHTSATLQLGPKFGQERLGHLMIAVTLDTYFHVAPSMQREASTALGALVFGS